MKKNFRLFVYMFFSILVLVIAVAFISLNKSAFCVILFAGVISGLFGILNMIERINKSGKSLYTLHWMIKSIILIIICVFCLLTFFFDES